MKQLNLATKFDENLRDVAVNQDDFKQALADFEAELADATDVETQLKLLGKIGTHQRILRMLDEAEASFEKAIVLAETAKLLKPKLANMIRLGNTKHWNENYSEAHRIFDECFEIISIDKSAGEYLDFVFQHKGKCCFDEGEYEQALKNFYEAILLRNNKSDSDLADSSLLAIEQTKRRWLPQVPESEVQKILQNKSIPDFVRKMLGTKTTARLSCINAALNYHEIGMDRITPFKPMELLDYLCKNTEQIFDIEDFQPGDLIVWWNRAGGSWDSRKIVIKNMFFDDPDFPYGLVFDHVAVRVASDIVFNKPNPSPDSEFKLDCLETAAYPSKLGKGHEITLHRSRMFR